VGDAEPLSNRALRPARRIALRPFTPFKTLCDKPGSSALSLALMVSRMSRAVSSMAMLSPR